MKKKKTGIIVMLLLVAVLAIALGVMTKISKSMPANAVVSSIATVPVEKNTIEEKLDASGTVESQNKKTFFSPVNAEITNLNVELGDVVKKGSKLVDFNLDNLEKDNTKAEMSVRSSQLDKQDAVDSANQAAGKQAAAAGKVGPLQSQVNAKQAEVDALKDKINKATTKAQKKAADEAQKQAEASAKAAQDAKDAITAAYDAAMEKYEWETLPNYQQELQDKNNALSTATAAYNQADSAYQQAFQLWNQETDEATKASLKSDLDAKETARTNAQNTQRQAQDAYDQILDNQPEEPAAPDYSSVAGSSAGITADSSTTADSSITADTTELQSKLEKASTELAELQAELSQQKSLAEADVAGVSSASMEKMDISTNLNELEAKSVAELIEEGKKGISAEFDGVISDCKIVQGTTVSQGMELFTVESIDDVSVEITVSKNDYDKLKEGETATITMADQTYDGIVEKVNRIATVNEKGTPMIGARVKITNPDENIFLGVEAKVKLDVATAADALTVPVEAVNVGNSGNFCYVVDNGVIVKKNVETGISSNDYTEIKSGLTEGDQVILDIGTYEEGDAVTADPGAGAQEAASSDTEYGSEAESTDAGKETEAETGTAAQE